MEGSMALAHYHLGEYFSIADTLALLTENHEAVVVAYGGRDLGTFTPAESLLAEDQLVVDDQAFAPGSAVETFQLFAKLPGSVTVTLGGIDMGTFVPTVEAGELAAPPNGFPV